MGIGNPLQSTPGVVIFVVGMVETCDRVRSMGQWPAGTVASVEGANKRPGGQGVTDLRADRANQGWWEPMRNAVHDRQIANLDGQLCIISSPIPRPSIHPTPLRSNFPTSSPCLLLDFSTTSLLPAARRRPFRTKETAGKKESVDRRRASASVHLPYCKASPTVPSGSFLLTGLRGSSR